MQKNLDLLTEYCIWHNMKVNIRKTNIMFLRGQRQGYVIYAHLYLVRRILIKWSITCIWVFALIGMDPLLKLKLLHDKASKAMHSLTDIMLKLFEMCVEPNLLYGCEM